MKGTCTLASKFVSEVLCRAKQTEEDDQRNYKRLNKRPQIVIDFLEKASNHHHKKRVRVATTRLIQSKDEGKFEYVDEAETTELFEKKNQGSVLLLNVIIHEPDGEVKASKWVVFVFIGPAAYFYDPSGELKNKILELAIPLINNYNMSGKNDDWKATTAQDYTLAWASLFAYLKLNCPLAANFFFMEPHRQRQMISNWMCLLIDANSS